MDAHTREFHKKLMCWADQYIYECIDSDIKPSFLGFIEYIAHHALWS